MLGLGCIKNH